MEFQLKKWEEKYIHDVEYHANNKKIADNLRNAFPYPYSYEDANSFVTACVEDPEECQMCRAIIVGDEAVGSIGIFLKDDVYCKSAELGYWLGEEFWGHGIMSQAIEEICRKAFEQYDIIRIFAEPYAHNTGSRKALEKAGFELEGILRKSVYKNDEIFDSCIYSVVR